MALETLNGIEKINGFEILRKSDRPKLPYTDEVDWEAYDEMRKERPIAIDDEQNMISFRIQNGPIKENGANGCQVDELLATALLIIKGLNKKFPSTYNMAAVQHIYSAMTCLEQRKLDRQSRGVEGESKL